MGRAINRIHVHHHPRTDRDRFSENSGKLSSQWQSSQFPSPPPKVVECWDVRATDTDPGYVATQTFSNEKG